MTDRRNNLTTFDVMNYELIKVSICLTVLPKFISLIA